MLVIFNIIAKTHNKHKSIHVFKMIFISQNRRHIIVAEIVKLYAFIYITPWITLTFFQGG